MDAKTPSRDWEWNSGWPTRKPEITGLSLRTQTEPPSALPGHCSRWALVLRSILVHPGSCRGEDFAVWQRVRCISTDIPDRKRTAMDALRAPAGKLQAN